MPRLSRLFMWSNKLKPLNKAANEMLWIDDAPVDGVVKWTIPSSDRSAEYEILLRVEGETVLKEASCNCPAFAKAEESGTVLVQGVRVCKHILAILWRKWPFISPACYAAIQEGFVEVSPEYYASVVYTGTPLNQSKEEKIMETTNTQVNTASKSERINAARVNLAKFAAHGELVLVRSFASDSQSARFNLVVRTNKVNDPEGEMAQATISLNIKPNLAAFAKTLVGKRVYIEGDVFDASFRGSEGYVNRFFVAVKHLSESRSKADSQNVELYGAICAKVTADTAKNGCAYAATRVMVAFSPKQREFYSVIGFDAPDGSGPCSDIAVMEPGTEAGFSCRLNRSLRNGEWSESLVIEAVAE